MGNLSEELKMYTKTWEDDVHPPEYLYGPPWKAMELYMEGGYPTPEEAIKAWEEEQKHG